MLLLLLPLAAAAEPACLPTATWVERATLDIINGAEDHASLDAALASMKCEPVSRKVLAAWFRAEGVYRARSGDDAGATRAFAASHALDPDAELDPRFGNEFASRYAGAPAPTGTLTLDIDTNRTRLWVDTKHARLPVTLAPGDHYLEVRDWHGGVPYNAVVNVNGGLAAQVETNIPEHPRHLPGEKHPERAWLVASATSLALCGASFGASELLLHRVETADTLADAESANAAKKTLAWGGVGLGGVSAAFLGVYIVVR
jgi:hypothetical protein